MMKFLWVFAALISMFVTGETLTCNSCRVGFKGKCLYRSTENCNDSQSSCYSGELAFNISHFMTLQTQGCMALSLCNRTESGAPLTAGYTVTRTCCSTDCCNGATSTQLTLTAALSATLEAVRSTSSL